MGIIKKYIKKIILLKNESSRFFYKGKIEIGEKTKFYQKLKLYDISGDIKIGKNCFFGYEFGGGFRKGEIEIQTRDLNAKIEIGDNVYTNNNLFICCRKSVKIGNKTLIGKDVVIMDHNGHGISPSRRYTPGTAKEIEIKENVWLGNNVVILPGTIIGKNSIVGANSVVKGVFPENVVIQGNPAKIMKRIEEI